MAERTTWFESVITRERVFLPWVASISLLSVLASSRNLRIGEDPGFTMAIILSFTRELPKPIFNNRGFSVITTTSLLEVLGLFPAFFQLSLEIHCHSAHFSVLAFIGTGINLSKGFLQDEVKLPAKLAMFGKQLVH